MIGSDAPQHDFLSNYMLREVMLKTVPHSDSQTQYRDRERSGLALICGGNIGCANGYRGHEPAR
jgi:hypothetical protein